jgi:uncharacterized repeat protein (TIGR02543 family)
MAYPTIASYLTGSLNTNGTTSSIIAPSGTQANDLIVLIITKDGTGTFTVPSDWTSLANTAYSAQCLGIFYRKLTAPLSNFTITHANEMTSWVILRIPNGDIPKISTIANGSSTLPNPASLTSGFATNTETLWLACAGWDYNRTASGFPSNMADNRYSSVCTSTGGSGTAMATASSTSASFDPATFTMGATDTWSAYTLAVKTAIMYDVIVTPTDYGITSLTEGTTYQYAQGNTCEVTQTPETGYKFVKWTVNGTDYTTQALSFTVTENTTISLTYEVDPYSYATIQNGGAQSDSHMGNTIPFDTYYHDSRLQYVLLASDLISSGLQAGTIYGIQFLMKGESPDRDLDSFKIRMNQTSLTQMNAWDSGLTMCTTVTNDPISTTWVVDQWRSYTFDTPYVWDGVQNLVIDLTKDNAAYTTAKATMAVLAQTNGAVAYRGDSTTTWDFSASAAAQQSFIPLTRFAFIADTSPHIENLQYSTTKISDELNKDSCSVSFTCSQSIDTWEARATNETVTPENRNGLIVGSGTTLSANTTASFVVDDEELTQGDRIYTIRVYVEKGGVWY